jgi:phospholipase/carboxylesterase
MSGLKAASPFTHLAPISAIFHVMMLEILGSANIDGRPIYLTHGAQDWMFDIDVARVAHQVLEERGADIVYREIAYLSHAYPRDENPKILNWFLG